MEKPNRNWASKREKKSAAIGKKSATCSMASM